MKDGKENLKLYTKFMQLRIPNEINILLRRYALETGKGNREDATVYIITNFLNELYKIKK